MQFVLLFLFFLSGFASLVYEVLWTRLFGLMLGNTTLAVSCVLAAFFTGLALGGRYFGRRADVSRSPLRLFALMEAAILASALLVLLLQGPIAALITLCHPGLLPHPWLYYLIRFAIAFVVMLPATFFMGGTLPVISRAFVRRRESGELGLLYGVNTLGAMSGALATAFLLLPRIGMTAGFAAAMGIDLLIALTALGLGRRAEVPSAGPAGAASRVRGREERAILAAMAISGFIAMSYEVLWSRILVFLLTSATYSFSIMLAAFLGSIALGGLAGGFWAERTRSPQRLLGWIEAGAGAAALLALVLLLQMPGLQNLLFTPSPTTTWWQWNAVRFFQAFLVTSIAAFLLGATFPVAVKSLTRADAGFATTVGDLYFFNTLGGVLGSLASGLVLIAWLGAAAAMMVMVVLNLLLGAWLLLRHRFTALPAWGGAALLLAFLTVQLTPADLLTRIYSVAEQEYPLIAMREGIEGTVTVHRHARGDEGERRIDVDGLNVAGSSFMLRTLQLLQGHLPLLMHPDPHRVLQIGFGTGQTSWAALRHPVEQFQLVEISPDVLRLSAELFRDLNQNVRLDPRFQPLILDGKNQLRYSGDTYDIIMNDANYAVATASASLFTRDHFENGRDKLAPGGIFSTWMTTDLHPEDFRIVLRTFQSVFPHAVLWMAPNCINKQVVLMGSTAPLVIDWKKWQKRFAAAAPGLATVNIGSPGDLAAALLLDEEGMARLCQGAAINSDDHPVLEFSTRDVRARDLCAFQNLSAMLAQPPQWRRYLRLERADSAAVRQEQALLSRYERASRQMFQGMLQFYQGQSKRALTTMLDGARLIPESRLASGYYEEVDRQSQRLFQALNQSPAEAAPRLELTRHFIGLERYAEAAQTLWPLLQPEPVNPLAACEAARLALAQGSADSARLWIDRCLARDERMAGAWYLSGRIAERGGALERALADYSRALALDPGMHEAEARIGQIRLQQGDYAAAQRHLRRSLAAAPAQGATAAALGDALLLAAAPAEALDWYRRALELGENNVRTLHNLGNALAMTGRFAEAVPLYRAALQLAPDQAELHYNLGNALIRTGQEQEAALLLQRAIDLDAGQADYYNNLAMLYRKMGDRSAALRLFDAGLRRHPDAELLRQNRRKLLDDPERRSE